MDCNNNQPGERIGHIAACYQGFMLIWGGYQGYNDDFQTNYQPPNELWIYDVFEEKWIKRTCTYETDQFDIPPGTSGACSCIINDNLYVFGGYHEEGNSKNIYRLDLRTLRWKMLDASGIGPIACDKSACWEYQNKLYIFGGYGVPHVNGFNSTNKLDYQFVLDSNSHWHYRRGWNNQFVCFDPDKNEWSWPKCYDKAPLARAAHAAARVGNKVFIYGGRHGQTRMDDLNYLDMDTLRWHNNIAVNSKSPPGRSWHSFTPISDDLIILYGGFSQHKKPLNDCWMFKVSTLTWIEIELPFNKPRLWHTATCSPFGEIIVFGGGKQNILNYSLKNIYAGDVITIRFTPKSLLRLCLDATINYSKELESEFGTLPLLMQKLLNSKKIILNNKNSEDS